MATIGAAAPRAHAWAGERLRPHAGVSFRTRLRYLHTLLVTAAVCLVFLVPQPSLAVPLADRTAVVAVALQTASGGPTRAASLREAVRTGLLPAVAMPAHENEDRIRRAQMWLHAPALGEEVPEDLPSDDAAAWDVSALGDFAAHLDPTLVRYWATDGRWADFSVAAARLASLADIAELISIINASGIPAWAVFVRFDFPSLLVAVAPPQVAWWESVADAGTSGSTTTAGEVRAMLNDLEHRHGVDQAGAGGEVGRPDRVPAGSLAALAAEWSDSAYFEATGEVSPFIAYCKGQWYCRQMLRALQIVQEWGLAIAVFGIAAYVLAVTGRRRSRDA